MLSVLLSGFVGDISGLFYIFHIGEGIIAALITFPIIRSVRLHGSPFGVILLFMATAAALIAGSYLVWSGFAGISDSDFAGRNGTTQCCGFAALLIALLVSAIGIYGIYRFIAWMSYP